MNVIYRRHISIDFQLQNIMFQSFGPIFSQQTRFSQQYRCFPIISMPGNERSSHNYAGKIFLPPSALARLASLNIQYPMLFELFHPTTDAKTHAGVLEFTAEEGRVYLPEWMMNTLNARSGDIITICNKTLPLGKFVKIQPQSVNFLDITDPKAVLENNLRHFSTLTRGDIITIKYNAKLYDILVLEVKPGNEGISIVETDLEVDFAPPVGYEEPKLSKSNSTPSLPEATVDKYVVDEGNSEFNAFQGSGYKLNGKAADHLPLPKGTSEKEGSVSSTSSLRNSPPLRLPAGKLIFGFKISPLKRQGEEDSAKNETKKNYEEGYTLRKAKGSSGSLRK